MRDTDRASLVPTPRPPGHAGRRRETAGAEGGDSDGCGRGGTQPGTRTRRRRKSGDRPALLQKGRRRLGAARARGAVAWAGVASRPTRTERSDSEGRPTRRAARAWVRAGVHRVSGAEHARSDSDSAARDRGAAPCAERAGRRTGGSDVVCGGRDAGGGDAAVWGSGRRSPAERGASWTPPPASDARDRGGPLPEPRPLSLLRAAGRGPGGRERCADPRGPRQGGALVRGCGEGRRAG